MKEQEINELYMTIVSKFSLLPKEEQARVLPLLDQIYKS